MSITTANTIRRTTIALLIAAVLSGVIVAGMRSSGSSRATDMATAERVASENHTTAASAELDAWAREALSGGGDAAAAATDEHAEPDADPTGESPLPDGYGTDAAAGHAAAATASQPYDPTATHITWRVGIGRISPGRGSAGPDRPDHRDRRGPRRHRPDEPAGRPRTPAEALGRSGWLHRGKGLQRQLHHQRCRVPAWGRRGARRHDRRAGNDRHSGDRRQRRPPQLRVHPFKQSAGMVTKLTWALDDLRLDRTFDVIVFATDENGRTDLQHGSFTTLSQRIVYVQVGDTTITGGPTNIVRTTRYLAANDDRSVDTPIEDETAFWLAPDATVDLQLWVRGDGPQRVPVRSGGSRAQVTRATATPPALRGTPPRGPVSTSMSRQRGAPVAGR